MKAQSESPRRTRLTRIPRQPVFVAKPSSREAQAARATRPPTAHETTLHPARHAPVPSPPVASSSRVQIDELRRPILKRPAEDMAAAQRRRVVQKTTTDATPHAVLPTVDSTSDTSDYRNHLSHLAHPEPTRLLRSTHPRIRTREAAAAVHNVLSPRTSFAPDPLAALRTGGQVRLPGLDRRLPALNQSFEEIGPLPVPLFLQGMTPLAVIDAVNALNTSNTERQAQSDVLIRLGTQVQNAMQEMIELESAVKDEAAHVGPLMYTLLAVTDRHRRLEEELLDLGKEYDELQEQLAEKADTGGSPASSDEDELDYLPHPTQIATPEDSIVDVHPLADDDLALPELQTDEHTTSDSESDPGSLDFGEHEELVPLETELDNRAEYQAHHNKLSKHYSLQRKKKLAAYTKARKLAEAEKERWVKAKEQEKGKGKAVEEGNRNPLPPAPPFAQTSLVPGPASLNPPMPANRRLTRTRTFREWPE